MKISILGTNGFLSNAIAKYANVHGWQLDMYGLAEPEGICYNGYHKINLMDKDLDCVSMLNSDIIIYAIGSGIQSNLNESLDSIYTLNVTTPINICNNLKAKDYKGVFVTFGSYFELGESDLQRPATEQDIINANAPAPTDYVVSKRMLTRFVTSYKHTYTHWHFILPTIYGPGENPNRLIPYTINAIQNGEKMHFTSGVQIRQYLYVGDVVQLIAMAYANALSSGIYNMASTEILSVRDLIETIASFMQTSVPIDAYGTEKRLDIAMRYLALNGDNLKNALNERVLTTKIIEYLSIY